MSNEIEAITVKDGNGIVSGTDHIAVTEYGIEFDSEHRPTIDEWLSVVNRVQKIHGMSQFYLGDLIVFAESPVTGWGESKYTDLIEATGYDYQTLRIFASVARRFNPTVRKLVYSNKQITNSVTFAHFQHVASLDDEHALYFLEKVAEGRWTVRRLREEIERLKNRNIVDLDDEEYDEKDVVPTFGQVTKEMVSWAKKFAVENNADIIRVQIIKGGKVIDEKSSEVY